MPNSVSVTAALRKPSVSTFGRQAKERFDLPIKMNDASLGT